MNSGMTRKMKRFWLYHWPYSGDTVTASAAQLPHTTASKASGEWGNCDHVAASLLFPDQRQI